jgi:hypothetical protein
LVEWAAEPKRWMSVTAPVSALIGLREGQTDPAGRAGHDRGSGAQQHLDVRVDAAQFVLA